MAVTALHYESPDRPKNNKGEPWCLDGQHELYKPPHGGSKKCKHCGVSQQTLRSAPPAACVGEFRVVCKEPGCDFGRNTDAEGNGYENFTLTSLARGALIDHQNEVEGRHEAFIQQHPVPGIVGDE